MFLPFGKIVDVFIPYDGRTGDHKPFGFIEFQELESAEKAQIALDGSFVDGRAIQVQFAGNDRSHTDLEFSSHTITNDMELPRTLPNKFEAGQSSQNKRLCITGFDSSLTMQALQEKFIGFGKITDVYIPQNCLRRDQKAYGFVEFHKFESAEEAKKAMNSSFIDGDRISVQFTRRTDSVGSFPSYEDTESRTKRAEFPNHPDRKVKLKDGPDTKDIKPPSLSQSKEVDSVEVAEKSSADFMNMAAQE